ncbi:MAG TPA: hypothetical protein VKC63_03320 [Solirubrobacterales bacterium]|nr:hypothetical protein [Solirubrobacterales bacterium]
MKAKMAISLVLVSVLTAASLLAAGCGGGGSSTSTAGNTSTPGESSQSTEGQEAGSGGAPSEAQAAATGDIPDNQVFLLFHDPKAGYSIRYPEGWARKGSTSQVTFQEKANVIHVSVGKGAPPTEASAVSGVENLRKTDSTVHGQAAEKLTIGGKPVVKITYSRLSAPDPVTGKRLKLIIDRYEYGNKGKVAVLDLATPEGVDNVDAYRMISESFEWQR